MFELLLLASKAVLAIAVALALLPLWCVLAMLPETTPEASH